MSFNFADASGKTTIALLRTISTASDSVSTACAHSTPSDRASSSGASTPRFDYEEKSPPRWGDMVADTDDHTNDEESDAAESENGTAPRTTRRRKRRRGRRSGAARKSLVVTATDISVVAHEENKYLTSGNCVPKTNLNERAAVALFDLGLLVSLPPSAIPTHRVLHSLTLEEKPLPRARQAPKPISLEHFSECAKPATTSSLQGIASTSPVSAYLPRTPGASEEAYRTRTPSMLWPSTPMAWPTMKQGMRIFAASPDVGGYESSQAPWGKVIVAPVSPAWLACSPSANGYRSRLRSTCNCLLSPTGPHRELQAASSALYDE